MVAPMEVRGTHALPRLLLAALGLLSCSVGFAGEAAIPSRPLQELGSPEFRIRERAELELVEWGREES